MSENNSNKNIWLAVGLAIITSITSLGTAFISKEEPGSNVVLEIKEELKVFKKELVKLKKTNRELNRLIFINENKSSRKLKKFRKEIDSFKKTL